MSAVTLAELSRLRKADTAESTQLTDAITTELRMALGYVIPKAQEYVASVTLDQYALLQMDTLFIPRRTRLISVEPFVGNSGIPSPTEVRNFTSKSAVLMPVSDGLMLAPRQGQLVVRDHRVSLDGQLLFETISTRRLARGIANHTWAAGGDLTAANAVLWDLVLMPLEDLRQQIQAEL